MLSFRFISNMITTCDFRFVCPLNWEDMPDLPDGSGKNCTKCPRPVVTVHNRREFNAAAKRGDCVAVYPKGRGPSSHRTHQIGDPILPGDYGNPRGK